MELKKRLYICIQVCNGMKSWIFNIFFFLLSIPIFGQSNPKYVLIEHFTNTWCPICASRNPELNALILKYPKNVHHVSIHPPYPYLGCPLYQYNKTENQARANYYNIQGTPSVVVNGGAVSGGSPLLTENNLKTEISKTSAVSLVVTESKNGSSRTAKIRIKSSVPVNGSLKLFAMIVEKNLRFTASNGELDHYNVFRKFLTPAAGQPIIISTSGEQSFDFAFNEESAWKSEEIYVLAFVQNESTKEVLNSGTKFDELSTSISVNINTKFVKVFPTVATEELYVEFPTNTANAFSILNIQGQSVLRGAAKANQNSVNIHSLTQGVYWLKINDGKDVYIAKFIKR